LPSETATVTASKKTGRQRTTISEDVLPGARILPYVLAGVDLRAEGRSLLYKFDRFGYSKTENDLLWQAGLTLKI